MTCPRQRQERMAGMQHPALLLAGWTMVAVSASADDRPIDFDSQIRPILSQTCFACHGPDVKQRKADLRLDRAAGLRSVTTAADPEDSPLWQRITSHDPEQRMPPVTAQRQLTIEHVRLLKRWIEDGARYTQHWAYVVPRAAKPPAVRRRDWPSGSIDRFILSTIERAGLSPAPAADRITLIRRLSRDLTGLPPTVMAVDAFVRDNRPDATERLVDSLLDSPHYGERMAMYWLDLVRYADTVGYHGDQVHHISPYRDYVIAAFNNNLPFDRFTLEQLAGDLAPQPSVDQKIASGYNRLLQTTHEGGAQDKEYLAKYAADRVRNVSSVWMGVTLGCCECHDHKYDPFTARDFYSMAAFFADVQERGNFRSAKRDPEILVHSPLDQSHIRGLERQIKALRRRAESASSKQSSSTAERLAVQIEALEKEHQALLKAKRPTMITVAVAPRPVRILQRGDWQDTSGELVQPAVPQALGQLAVSQRRATRRDLAQWLTARDNPLTARVLANRLWYLFFGRGLFDSLQDTGSQGSVPTHPALLNHLALELINSGWDVKYLVKRIVMSSAYRQSSQPPDDALSQDPGNRYFARQSRFRLPAEMIRDGALSVSGLLNDRLGGPSVHPYQPTGYYAHLNFPKRTYRHDSGPNQYRRGIYTHWQRQFLHPMLRAFDGPSREECTARREASNTPAAALALMNDPSFVESARALATRTLREGGGAISQRIDWVWRRVLSRPPSEFERQTLRDLLLAEQAFYDQHPNAAEALISVGESELGRELPASELAAWMAVTRVMLNLHETITRD